MENSLHNARAFVLPAGVSLKKQKATDKTKAEQKYLRSHLIDVPKAVIAVRVKVK